MRLATRPFILAQIASLTIIVSATMLLPDIGLWRGALPMIAVWLLCIGLYRMTPHPTQAGGYTLLVVYTMLAIGVVANVHLYTVGSGASDEMPVLLNDDASRYFRHALCFAKGEEGELEYRLQLGYPWFIAQIWRVTGISIFAPLVVNMALILGAIIVSGMVCGRILRTGKAELWGMIATASVCYYLATGTLLLKEAGTALAIALAGYALTYIVYPEKSKGKEILIFALALALLSIFRFNYIPIVAIGVVLVTPWRRESVVVSGVMLLLCIVVWGVNYSILLPSEAVDNYMSGIGDGSTMKGNYFYDHPQHRAHNEMIGNYIDYPIWKKILWLPISAITQFLIPFSWGMERDICFGYTLAYARIGYPWYLIVGAILYGLWQTMRDRKSTGIPMRWIIVGIVLWLIPAYLFAGTVSRYALCFLPLLVPLAVDTIQKHWRTRAFRIYTSIYIAVLAATLITCHHLQASAI